MTALEGIRVLDFSHALAGPLCTYHLALLGADVVKIERPGQGDDLRHYTGHGGPDFYSAPFVAANAGKRSIVLDLKSDLGKEAVRRLAITADVIVENFRPGVPVQLGIDYESMRKINQSVIYCSVTGFGGTGEFKNWAAYDHIIQAMSGIMWLNGEPTQGPLKVGIPFADTFAGYLAAFSIMTALFKRSRTGSGQAVSSVQLSGQLPLRTGNRGYRLTATADTYATKDGFLSIGANHQHQFEALCKALGQDALLDDPRFASAEARSANYEALREKMVTIFAEQSAEVLERTLAAVKVPVAKVRTVRDTLELAHVKSRELFVEAVVPGVDSPVNLTGSGFRFSESTPRARAAVPGVGEHTEDILREIDLTREWRSGGS
jgi:CoA:oxalate CoA-transferase